VWKELGVTSLRRRVGGGFRRAQGAVKPQRMKLRTIHLRSRELVWEGQGNGSGSRSGFLVAKSGKKFSYCVVYYLVSELLPSFGVSAISRCARCQEP